MIDHQHLDIRTITMGISLLDCADRDAKALRARRSTTRSRRYAEELVKTGEAHRARVRHPHRQQAHLRHAHRARGRRLRRRRTTFPLPSRSTAPPRPCGVNFIGGFSALVQKGMTDADRAAHRRHSRGAGRRPTLSARPSTSARPRPASTWTRCALMGQHRQGRGGAHRRLRTASAARSSWCSATLWRITPLWPARSTASARPERVINVGVSGPGVVYHALQSVKGQPFDVVAETVKKTAFRITRMGQLVAQEASRAARYAVRHRRSLPRAHARRRRQRGPYSGGDGP